MQQPLNDEDSNIIRNKSVTHNHAAPRLNAYDSAFIAQNVCKI